MGISAVADGCPFLNNIDLSGCRQITDESLLALSRRSRHLTNINISGCFKITDVGVSALVRYCRFVSPMDITKLSKSLP